MKKLVIVAALEREVSSLVKGWPESTVEVQNRRVKIYEHEAAVVAVAGIGVINARIAAGAAHAHVKGEVAAFISAGLAGALIPELEVGEIFTPKLVVDDVDGGKIETAGGEGVLVTASSVAGSAAKLAMVLRHLARAVDMEAYAVGDVARIYGAPFRAVKAISDKADFPMPPLSRFVSESGHFQTASFALYAAMRPWLWPTVMALGKNSAAATEKLCAHLGEMVRQHAAGLYNSSNPSSNPVANAPSGARS